MATFYVAQTALGTGDGSTAANAKGMSWLNTAGSWNGATGTTICATATTDSVQDVIRFVGTISTAFAWPSATYAGAAGIKFAFDAGAKFSAATFTNGAMKWESGAYNKHNVTIDGENVGIIECTDAGTALGNQVGSVGIWFVSANNVTIKRLTIRNLYVRTFPSNDQVDGGSGIYGSTSSGAYTGLLVEDCTLHDMNIAVNVPYANGSANYTFRRNECYNVNWGIGCGSTASDSSMTGFLAEDNWFHDFEKWGADIGFEAFHHNGIFCFGSNGTNNFADAIIRRNKFGPNFGERATSGVYLSSYGMIGTYEVYNNLFVGSTSNGLITIGTGNGATTRVMNNTFLCNDAARACINIGGSSSTGMTVYLRNNVCEGGQFIYGNYTDTVTLDSDYNTAGGYSTPPNVTSWSSNENASPRTWAQWQAMGHDAHSLHNATLLLDADGRPGTGSPALEAGVDLSAYFTTDYDEATRVAPWDIGAYEGEGEAPPATTTPNPLAFRSNAMLGMGSF